MGNLTNKIIKRIQAEEIRPIPRHIFLIRNIGLWALSILSVGVGSISISLLIYNVANKDWDVYSHLGESMFGFLVSSLPYLWIILIIISLAIAVLNFEHSKNGYKYSPLKITIASILLTLIFGSSGYALGVGEKIDSYFGSKFTSYQSVEAEKKIVWNQPENGLFSGTIKTVDRDKKTFILDDFQGKQWTVNYADATIRGKITITENIDIKIVGQKTGDAIDATDIRTWGNTGNGQGFDSGNRKNKNNNNSN
ncbi:MAG: hypothetical protein WCG48_03490 [Candidatus Berkelbacteria bacterium]